ncbi:hypothetical protein MOK15_05210 [Sphingobium sp. BYY-5]|uniref:hypothetical protein n=1 Tax=Sphingobium sp. BYY-5 TaxID=2926400 RepID=UPI001FA7769C|nr:hypothetical protein [Sphingobium sp. BYY-5]MCI4589489.1 hypothetical protein [Sphingobium sp. BYY-5]
MMGVLARMIIGNIHAEMVAAKGCDSQARANGLSSVALASRTGAASPLASIATSETS